MQVHAVAVPRQGDIAAMGVHARRRQYMGAVHRHALGLVDGCGIAMVDPIIILEVEANGSAVIGLHGHGLRADLFDDSQRAVLHAKAAFILQEHDAVARGEVALAALDRQVHLIAQIAATPHWFARRLVQRAHLVVGVGEDDPAALRRCLPVAVPALDQIAARLLAGSGFMHHAVGAIGLQRIVGPAGCQIARGVPLPVLPLTAHFADFRAAIRPWTDRNAAPASIACNCLISPTSTTLAPASAAWDSTCSSWRVPTIPASSITRTSRAVSRSR